MARIASVHRLPAGAPDDIGAIAAAIEAGAIDPNTVVAVFGKTEGNGCVNDFTRALAVRTLRGFFLRHLSPAAVDAIALVMSGGTEGGLSPHWLVFTVSEAGPDAAAGPALAIGRARTPVLRPEELGRRDQVLSVAAGVRAAMDDAGIEDSGAVHYVQVKCPLLTSERIAEARARGARPVTEDTLKSMGLSRGASALGVAVALSEVAAERIRDDSIGGDLSLYSSRCGASAGVELMDHEVVVMGLSAAWSGPLTIGHAAMRDAIDVEPVRVLLERLGVAAASQLGASERERIKAVLAKAEAATSGVIRGQRHTMLTDSDIASTRHARGFVAGALAAVLGFTDLFVSGGAEHQGPDGGGPVAVIASRT